MGRAVIAILTIIISTAGITNSESILNWFWKKSDDSTVLDGNGVPLFSIPFDSSMDDEKFLQQAAKFTETQATSPLEICQHKIIMKIKTSCHAISEEELAKMSVNLLNCQSITEGRKIFPCTDEMSIKECTENMDADMWNTYHLMSNRARAVCFVARQLQFRTLTELTVNKLMQSTHTQIHALESLKENQDKIKEKSSEVISSLHKGNNELLEDQKQLENAQIVAKKLILTNMYELNKEKAIIRAGHVKLVTMTEDIQNQIDKINEKFQGQFEIHDQRYEDVIRNLTTIQNQANKLLNKIETSANQYEKTLKKLQEINESINFMWDLTNKMKREVDNTLGWMNSFLGDSEEQRHKIYQISTHVAYLIMSVILAAFLQAPLLTRVAIISITPLNLISYWKYGSQACLDFISITMLISLITALHYLLEILSFLFLYMKTSTIEQSENIYASEKLPPVKKVTILRRIYNELYCDYHAICNFFRYIKDKLKMFFRSSIYTIRSATPREMLTRSCSYIPFRKPRENIINRDEIDPDLNISDINMNNTLEDSLVSEYNEIRRRQQHKHFTYDYLECAHTRSSSPSDKKFSNMCNARTKSGKLCKSNSIKGYNYCSKHYHNDQF